LGSVGILLGFNWNPIEGILKSNWNYMGNAIGSYWKLAGSLLEFSWSSTGILLDCIRTHLKSSWGHVGICCDLMELYWNSVEIRWESYGNPNGWNLIGILESHGDPIWNLFESYWNHIRFLLELIGILCNPTRNLWESHWNPTGKLYWNPSEPF